MITWIVQENLAGEQEYDNFVAAIQKVAPLQIVKVVPFGHDLIPEVEGTNNVAFGSLTLEKIARQRNWRPGTFTNNNHNFERWAEGYRGYLLNEDAKIVRFGSAATLVESFGGRVFMRPLDDSKIFAGLVIDSANFREWREATIAAQDSFSTLTENTEIMVAAVKEIASEYRFFVVNKEIVTGSQYRQHGFTRKRRVEFPSDHPAYCFARNMIARWQPSKNFVIDVCQMDNLAGTYKVVEINSLTSSGFYACDSAQIVGAMHRYLSSLR